MNEFQVTCINKSHPQGGHEHITHIGNIAAGWRLTREAAIVRIENKTEAFYTEDPYTKKRAYIGVVRESGKAPYLRTYADGQWNNNLLAQPECSGACSTIA
jgi:hypothetical protein